MNLVQLNIKTNLKLGKPPCTFNKKPLLRIVAYTVYYSKGRNETNDQTVTAVAGFQYTNFTQNYLELFYLHYLQDLLVLLSFLRTTFSIKLNLEIFVSLVRRWNFSIQ